MNIFAKGHKFKLSMPVEPGGPITLNGKVLTRADGTPIMAGSLVAGDTVEVNAMTLFETDYAFGDKVSVDGGDVIATVIGFCFYSSKGMQVQVSWWNNGALVEQWVDECRLALKVRA